MIDQKTDKPEIVYRYIVEFKMLFDGNSPSIREIAEACDISSTSLVHYYLEKLVDRKLIMMSEGLAHTKILVLGGNWRLTNGE